MGKVLDAKVHLESSKFWQELSDRGKESLFEILRELKTKSPEELYKMLMVGACPQCGSNQVKDCEDVADIEDNTVGFCLACGFVWCLECGHEMTGNICPHWSVCDECEEADQDRPCPHEEQMSECPDVKGFMEGLQGPRGKEDVAKNEMAEEMNPDAAPCGFCNKLITDESRNTSFIPIAVKKEFFGSLQDHQGSMIRLPFGKMMIPAIVSTPDSEAKRNGWDLIFPACSSDCARKLKDLLKAEVKFVQSMGGDSN